MATRHIEMQEAVNLCIQDDLLSINNREEMEKKLLNGEDTGLQYWELRMFYKELEHIYDAEFYKEDEHTDEVLEENALAMIHGSRERDLREHQKLNEEEDRQIREYNERQVNDQDLRDLIHGLDDIW